MHIAKPVFFMYFQELYYLAEGIKNDCEKLFTETEHYKPIDEWGNVIDTRLTLWKAPEVHRNINSILIYAANIHKLIDFKVEYESEENEKILEHKRQRKLVFEKLLKDVDMVAIKHKKVRNTLEHFDEKMDELSLKLLDNQGKIRRRYEGIAYNMCVSNWSLFKRKLYPIKVYDVKKRIFYNLDESISIYKLYNEALAILNRLERVYIKSNKGQEKYFKDGRNSIIERFRNW